MKKLMPIFAALAFLIIQGCAGDVISYTDDTISGDDSSTTTLTDPDLGWSATEYEANLGGSNSFPTLTNEYGVSVTYSSSDNSIATISSDGSVTLLAVGTTTITAYSAETDEYEESSAYYTLTVVRSESDLAWSATSATAAMGEDNDFPTLTNSTGLEVTYTSSDTNVATIDSDGDITLVAAGTTTITAATEETDTYEAASASYTLTVTKSSTAISWSESTCTVTLGSSKNSFPTLNNPASQAITYSSSNENIATIDASGNVTLVAEGSCSIIATSTATDTYESTSAHYALTVQAEGSDLVSPEIAWSSSTCSATMGSTPSYPTLSNPNKVSVSYASNNTDVATIDDSGNVTLVGAGTAIITASSEATDTYTAGSTSYTLSVSLASAGLAWSSDNCTATLKSDDNSLPTLTNTSGIDVTYASSNTDVATVDESGNVTLVGAGTTAITASNAATSVYAASSVSYTLKVVKNSISISWSSSACTAVLEESDNTFPTLSVDPSGLDISYTSSDTGVATIDSNGDVTIKSTGKTTISASFEGNTYYKASSASYTLTVNSSADDGAVETTFASSGDTSSDDDISNTTFTRLVTVTYSSSGASVSGYSAVSDCYDVSVSGNQVTITYTGSENVVYKLSGTASDGFFKLYSSKKQAIWLSGASITCSSGAAINNQSGKRTFVYVEGTNKLADGSSATYSADGDEDMKGVFFSEGQLIFSGSGSLSVTANNSQSKSGIVSDDYVRFMSSPTVTVTSGSSAGHGVKSNDYVQISNGTLNVTTKASMKKGITTDDYVLVEGGTTTVTVSGGTAYDSDEGEYTGTAGIKADNYFGMTGGTVTITNTGSGGKGVRAGNYDYYTENGSLTDSYISGGTLTIKTSGSESNDVSCKAIKIGFKEQTSSNKYTYGGNMVVNGGDIVINCSKSEGFEVKGTLTFNGGSTYVYSTGDDAINSQGEMNVNGGYIMAYSTANDAMDTNSNLKLNGGYTYAITTAGTPEVAIDANTESGYKLYINSGATVVAYGGLESGYSASQSVYSFSAKANAWNALHNGSSYIAAFKAPSSISSFVVSAPSLSKGYTSVTVSSSSQTCNGYWAGSGISGGTATSLTTYSGGGSSGGPGGSGGGPGGGPGGGW